MSSIERIAVRNRSYSNKHHARGLTLVEILIAVLVISVGLLGVAGLHSLSLRNNYDALMRSKASALASDIADRMRANRAEALDGDYDIDFATVTPAVAADSPVSVLDLNQWRTALAAALPQGTGEIDMDIATRIVTITIRWGERNVDVEFETATEI